MNQNPYATPQAPAGQPSQPAPPMTIKKLLFSFQGRINRAKYWGAMLGIYAVLIVLVVIAGTFSGGETTAAAVELNSTGLSDGASDSGGDISGGFLLVLGVLYIVFGWMGLALQAKRWHDRGKSGWMILVNFIPLVGGIWALVECGFLSGTPGPNQYGPDPLMR